MSVTRQRLGDMLIASRLINQEQLTEALLQQKRSFRPLGQLLVSMGFITEEHLLQVCALQKGVEPWFLQHDPPNEEALALLPAEICRIYQVLPVKIKSERLILAMRDPGDLDTLDMVRNMCRMRVEPVLVNEDRLLHTLDAVFHVTISTEAVSKIVTTALDEYHANQSEEIPDGINVITEADMRPVVALVKQILTDAVKMRASDIHFEPRANRVEIRFRVDGQLHCVHEIPAKLLPALVTRLKVLAGLDIVEYRVPQDGRIRFEVDSRPIDFRVSVLPNYHGQRIVLRVLDKNVTLRSMSDLGFSDHNQRLFENMISRPHGLILVTGPTGSGKTTTLYAALNKLKQSTNNIMTCEDPVEYDIDGINQSQVNEKVGLTFAAQLRAILRQDPDIVLVGEIRDEETAQTAVRAALTGHLVLSTLHCNDALSAVPRLTDMGIEPLLLSTALIGVTAQRLVRTLCPACRKSGTPDTEEQKLLEPYLQGDKSLLWRPGGCKQCNNTGYRGRAGVHELFPVVPQIQRAIASREPMETVRQLATLYGYRPMQDDVCGRILAGETSVQEAKRLVFFDTPVLEPEKELLRAA